MPVRKAVSYPPVCSVRFVQVELERSRQLPHEIGNEKRWTSSIAN